MLNFIKSIKLSGKKRIGVVFTALLLQLFLVIPFSSSAATAALTDYFRESWSTRQGLPHNTINSISQTPDGYLWFATWEGVARYNGCPIPDSDKDGINDEEDKCPQQAGVARYGGCPVPDTDGDGVNDEEDKCPTVAGIAANAGCPEVKEEIKTKVEFAARNIFFNTGSYQLQTKSYAPLNEVAQILKDNPTLKLDVEGHTDITGDAAKNQILSENRAAAVKAYLVAQGIERDRLTSAGYGIDKPIADNKTAAGKAKNRRVELKLRSY